MKSIGDCEILAQVQCQRRTREGSHQARSWKATSSTAFIYRMSDKDLYSNAANGSKKNGRGI